MQEPTDNNDLFQVTVTEESTSWLKRFGRLAFFSLIATVLVDGFHFYFIVPQILRENYYEYRSSVRLNNNLYLGFLLLNFLLQIIQVSLYVKFAQKANRAIINGDSFLFNSSFKNLYLQSVLFLLQILLSFCYFGYNVYQHKLG